MNGDWRISIERLAFGVSISGSLVEGAPAAGSEVVMIAASGNVSPFHLMARLGD
jgi:hypothetical protein